MLNCIVMNRTDYLYKNGFGIKLVGWLGFMAYQPL